MASPGPDQNIDNNSATGKLNGQVAPINTVAIRRIRLLSLVRNHVMKALMEAITA